MSTHNIGFYEEISKIITYHQISSNTHLISSADSTFSATQKCSGEVCFHHSFPAFQPDLGSWTDKLTTSVIHQKINLAKLRQGARHKIFHLLKKL